MLDAFLEYLAGVRKLSPHTIAAYRQDLEGWGAFCREWHGFDPLAGPAQWRQAQPAQLWAWLSRYPKATTRARKVAAVRAMDRYLRRVLREPGLPWVPTSPKLPKALPKALPQEVLAQSFAALEAQPESFLKLRDWIALELLYGCGLRRSEVAALQVSQVHLPLGQIHILGKGSKWRIVPLYPALRSLLERYLPLRQALKPSHDFLLCSAKGRPLHPRALYEIVRAHLGTHPHALRHSFATHLLAGGASVQAVKELLGHASLATTQKYLAVTPAELRAAYEKYHPRA